MKKNLFILAMSLLPMLASAEEVEIDGLWYNLVKKVQSAEVIQYKNNQQYSGDVVIPDIIKYEEVEYKVKNISDFAFSRCINLTSVNIGNNVTSIGRRAFENCTSLVSAIIGNGVTAIGGSAFSGCKVLSSVTIGNSVTIFWNFAFEKCSSLKTIIIPNSVERIGVGAFSGCSSLTTVTLGSGLKRVENQSFAYCQELSDVFCHAAVVPFALADAFKDSYIEHTTLHVPAVSLADYKAAKPWSEFKNVVTLSDDNTSISPLE